MTHLFGLFLLLVVAGIVEGATGRFRARVALGIAYAGWLVLWGLVVLLVVQLLS
jgi:hypothetical protein